jgi:magnesium transporter
MKLFRRVIRHVGSSPGSVIPSVEPREEPIRIQVLDWTETSFEEKSVTLEECLKYTDPSTLTWINISGIHEPKVIETIGEHFGLHVLVQEDIVHADQRPKIEDHEDHLFLILKMYRFENHHLDEEQISMILGEGFLITFQEKEGDVFEAVRQRAKRGKGRLRKLGSDYLAFALMDTIIDHYFLVIEKLGSQIEDLSEELLENPSSSHAREIFQYTTQISRIRRSIWPTRDITVTIQKLESRLIHKKTLLFFRDANDHLMKAADLAETFLDVGSGLINLHMSSLSNHMNQIMKVLTIMASIFIPLTFIAGIYGMNFDYMPELHWRMGYAAVLLVMLLVFIVMLIYFKKKKWL